MATRKLRVPGKHAGGVCLKQRSILCTRAVHERVCVRFFTTLAPASIMVSTSLSTNLPNILALFPSGLSPHGDGREAKDFRRNHRWSNPDDHRSDDDPSEDDEEEEDDDENGGYNDAALQEGIAASLAQ